jgi:hypothetical protein
MSSMFYHSGDGSWWHRPAIRLQPSLMQKVIDINIELQHLGASMARGTRILQEGKVGCAAPSCAESFLALCTKLLKDSLQASA